MDTLYRSGFPYPFDAGTNEKAGEQVDHSYELQRSESTPTSSNVEAVPAIDAAPASELMPTSGALPITSFELEPIVEPVPFASAELLITSKALLVSFSPLSKGPKMIQVIAKTFNDPLTPPLAQNNLCFQNKTIW